MVFVALTPDIWKIFVYYISPAQSEPADKENPTGQKWRFEDL